MKWKLQKSTLLVFMFSLRDKLHKWSAHACQKCQVKGQVENVLITRIYVSDSDKSCDNTAETFHSLSACYRLEHSSASFSAYLGFYTASLFLTSFCLLLSLCLSPHLSLLPLCFLSAALSLSVFCILPSLCFIHFLLLFSVSPRLADKHAPLPSLSLVFVVPSWVKVACHYRWRQRSDKGQKLRQRCLQMGSAGVSVHVCGVCGALLPEPIRQEQRRRIVWVGGGGSDCELAPLCP